MCLVYDIQPIVWCSSVGYAPCPGQYTIVSPIRPPSPSVGLICPGYAMLNYAGWASIQPMRSSALRAIVPVVATPAQGFEINAPAPFCNEFALRAALGPVTLRLPTTTAGPCWTRTPSLPTETWDLRWLPRIAPTHDARLLPDAKRNKQRKKHEANKHFRLLVLISEAALSGLRESCSRRRLPTGLL